MTDRNGQRRSALASGTLLALVGIPSLASLAAPQPRPVAKSAKPLAAKATPEPLNTRTPERVVYNRDIRPILSDNCFACHGPDKNKRMSGLRLDLRDEAVKSKAIVPGNPEQSAIIARVFAKDQDLLMPPMASHKSLSDEQKAMLKRWVSQGAEYQPHWAYIAPVRPAVPKLTDARYPVRNPIDAFIRQRLMEKRILPSAEADARMLLRRLYLDLTGMPPTTAEVEAFVAEEAASRKLARTGDAETQRIRDRGRERQRDQNGKIAAKAAPSPTPDSRLPSPYERVVDRLLASPHYGERMATPWLDVVRYADTVGFHGDQNQNAWAYRDYVIDSFNKNKPFDQFTTEQLAGDLLPNPTPEQRAATAYNRLNMVTREGGAQAKEYLAKYTADRVRTVSMTWLGSTFGCAECHDHKYDPISAKDFYSLGAFFADVKQWGVYADYGYTPNPDLKGYNNDFPFPPEIKIESRYLRERIARDRIKLAELATASGAALNDPAAQAAFDGWRKTGAAFLAAHPDGWETPQPNVEVSTAGVAKPKAKAPAPLPAANAKIATYRVEPDGRVLLTDSTPADVELQLKPSAGYLGALRVELLPSPENGSSVFRPGMEAAMVTALFRVQHAGGKPQPVTFRHAGANFADPRYRNGSEILGVQNGWKPSAAHKSAPHVSVWLPAAPLRLAADDTLEITLPNLPAGCVRVSVSPFVPEDADSPVLPAGLRSALEQGEPKGLALQQYLLGTAWNAETFARVKEVEADLISCRKGVTPVLVTEAWQPATMRVLPRGNWQDDSGAVVEPAVPHFLPGYDPSPSRRLNRLDLAKWIVAPENPLTARVYVNRLWKQFFGNGLSGQVEDLGAQGEWPTHPELLDWLAVEFRDSGWDVKHMVRLMVTSATYRQSSSLRPELREADPNNRLLASQNPRRLEAEFVRDNALAIAGLLNQDLGGPPVKPYQPDGYYANIQFPDRPYAPEADDRQWRRGIYVHWQRTFLHPALINFDAPSREDCIAARNVANTPQQALTLLNDPEFVEASRAFAGSLFAGKASTDAARLDLAFQRAVGRPAKAKERQSLLQFLEKIRAEYRQRPEDAAKLLKVGIAPAPAGVEPVELASWAMVCRVILNLHETITRY